jgi:thioredoxin-related protein
MKSIVLFVAVMVSAVFCAGCERKGVSAVQDALPTAKAEWLTNFEKAKAEAKAQNKTLLILFTGSDWCPPCMMLDREVLEQPEFAAYAAKHLVLLEVDFPRVKMQSLEARAENLKLASRYGIDGFPTVVLLDSSGEPIGALGYQPGGPKPFIAAIEKLSEAGGARVPAN